MVEEDQERETSKRTLLPRKTSEKNFISERKKGRTLLARET
jgi:hypothetical protein